MFSESSIAGGASFPATRWSAIRAVASEHEAERAIGFDKLISVYWHPVYVYLRLKWGQSQQDAQDTTQQFFTNCIEQRVLSSFDPARGRFRTFIRACADHFMLNEFKRAGRRKRGGDMQTISVDAISADGHPEVEIASGDDPARRFEQEWVRSLFSAAVSALRTWCNEEGKTVHFQLFERYDLQFEPVRDLTYEKLAQEFGLSVASVTNYLAAARKRFRELVLEQLREVTATEEEFAAEARELLGIRI